MNTNHTEFFIFRHGETDWNALRRFQGHTDIPLNDTGRLQATRLSEPLRAFAPQAMITSDLSRAQETGKIATQRLQLPVSISADLRECRLGDPEGMFRDDIMTKYGPDQWNRWASIHKDDEHFAFPNGESRSEHLKRMVSYLENYARENPEYKRVAVSTHGGCVRRLVHFCTDAPTEPVPIQNCIFYRIAFYPADAHWRFIR